MAMSNIAVAEAFAKGATRGKSANMRIEGDTLYSYNTVVAVRNEQGVAINTKKYSPTTSKQMTAVRGALNQFGYTSTGEEVPPVKSPSYYFPSDEPFLQYAPI